MEQTSQPRWKGKVSTTVTKANADQIWPLVKDFFNFHKWFPNLTTCYGIHGNNGEPGCIRYCAGSSISSVSVGDHRDQDRPVSWSKERLLAVDEGQRSLSYEIVESNIGFRSYVSTVRIVPGEESGCVIEWSFTVDPMEGWELDDLVKIYEAGLHRMAKKMEDAYAPEGLLDLEE